VFAGTEKYETKHFCESLEGKINQHFGKKPSHLLSGMGVTFIFKSLQMNPNRVCGFLKLA